MWLQFYTFPNVEIYVLYLLRVVRGMLTLALQIVETMVTGIETWSTLTDLLEKEGKRAVKKAAQNIELPSMFNVLGQFLSLAGDLVNDERRRSQNRQNKDYDYGYDYDYGDDDDLDFDL